MSWDESSLLKNAVAVNCVQESTRQRLERQKKALESSLEDVNKALELLNKNPELEEFHEALRRV